MELHMERVLNRDQRTARYWSEFEDCCANCRQNQRRSRSGDQEWDGVSSNSSLFNIIISNNNCHNQYCSKFKRLPYQTEVQCDGTRLSSGISEKKRVRCKSWLKQFHFGLLLATFLTLIVPYTNAVPTTFSSRSVILRRIRSTGMGEAQDLINSLTTAYREADSALVMAKHLKESYKAKSSTDPEIVYKDVPAYKWLPHVPTGSNKTLPNLSNLDEVKGATRKIYSHIQIMWVPVDLLERQFKSDPIWGGNFSAMRGTLDNLLEELNYTLNISELSSPPTDVMPEELKSLDKTGQSLRDWLFIKTLVEVLEYAVAVFKHFGVPLQNPK